MRARSALVELCGDHLLSPRAAAPVAAVVRLTEPFDIAALGCAPAASRFVDRCPPPRPVRTVYAPAARRGEQEVPAV